MAEPMTVQAPDRPVPDDRPGYRLTPHRRRIDRGRDRKYREIRGEPEASEQSRRCGRAEPPAVGIEEVTVDERPIWRRS
jgi:hypothetical protein